MVNLTDEDGTVYAQTGIILYEYIPSIIALMVMMKQKAGWGGIHVVLAVIMTKRLRLELGSST